jgi:hypothetical protein
MARAGEAIEADAGWQASCFSMSLLKPVPIKPLNVEAKIHRSGRSTQMVDIVLRDGDTELALATLWRIRRSPTARHAPALPYPAPNQVAVTPIVHPGWDPSYLSSVEWRFVTGSFFEVGPAVVWARARQPLVGGEETSPLGRVLTIADSGNGISTVLPLTEALYINVELTVHLIGDAVGEWICLDATTAIGDQSVGVARSTLWDAGGVVGYGAQSLLIAEKR